MVIIADNNDIADILSLKTLISYRFKNWHRPITNPHVVQTV